jgi:hypothetical protein
MMAKEEVRRDFTVVKNQDGLSRVHRSRSCKLEVVPLDSEGVI